MIRDPLCIGAVGEDPDGVLPTEPHAPPDVKLDISGIVWHLLCLICLIPCLFVSRIIIRMNHYLFCIYLHVLLEFRIRS